MQTIKEFYRWNNGKSYILEEDGTYIFSAEEAYKKYPWSVRIERYLRTDKPIDWYNPVSFYPWEFYMYRID